MDVSAKTDEELDAILINHRRVGALDKPLYVEALAELARRRGQGLSFEKSLKIIRDAAKARRFVGYKELAEASGAEWSRVHWSVGPHLDSMLEYCHRKGWPLLTAIVVRQAEVDDGELKGTSLDGFVKGCERLGLAVPGDAAAFVRSEQNKVFEWAQKEGANG
jgi:hypothetical protein